MSATTPPWRPGPTTSLASGLGLILVGILSVTISNGSDGFVKGLFIGAGVGLILIGVVVLSPLVIQKLRRSSSPAGDKPDPGAGEEGWLPSRDGGR